MKRNFVNIKAVGIVAALTYSCSSFLTIDPPIEEFTPGTIYSDASQVERAYIGLYAEASVNSCITYGIPVHVGCYSDDFIHNSSSFTHMYTNTYNALSLYIDYPWTYGYQYIYACNAFIDGLNTMEPGIITQQEYDKYTSDAIFLRALCHMYITLLFGDAPYITSSDVDISKDEARTPRATIFSNIVSELLEVEAKLKNYDSNGPMYVNVHSVRALLSRIYIYQENWTAAAEMATKVINESGAELCDPAIAFLYSSPNTVFHLSYSNSPDNHWFNGYTNVGRYFASSTGTYGQLRDGLLNSFEAGDKRKEAWTREIASGTFKGKIVMAKYRLNYNPNDVSKDESHKLFRIAEQHLIRAEAYINLNKLDEATDDLDMVRQRSGLAPLATGLDKTQLTEAMRHERRVELFAEDCHRWVDIIRWGIVEDVFATIEDKAQWEDHLKLLPIPQSQIEHNPHLTQNIGYQ